MDGGIKRQPLDSELKLMTYMRTVYITHEKKRMKSSIAANVSIPTHNFSIYFWKILPHTL